jgi:asparagine synthetase B (glutamine-hydrolysing)
MVESLPYRMTPFETAVGWLPGYSQSSWPRTPTENPVAALEEIILTALVRHPCVVAFSGGRDSSAVLAVAVHVARREGLPDPIPCSYVFPGQAAMDESAWQEAVVRHLRVADWERIVINDEHDIVGPYARKVLADLGPIFPPAAHTRELINARACGGAVLTGEGGDEVLGSKRSWVLANVVARRGLVRSRAHMHAAVSLLPAMVRRRRAANALTGSRPWLRPDAADRWRRTAAADEAGEPLDYRAATRRVLDSRALQKGLLTLELVAARHDVTLVHPLLDRRFVAAWTAAVGRLGPVSRTVAMRTLFSGVLPDDVLGRRSKAVFNGAAVHRHARAFAEAWDGHGVDHDLVDPERLRGEWLSDVPHAGSLALMQHAYLAQRGMVVAS